MSTLRAPQSCTTASVGAILANVPSFGALQVGTSVSTLLLGIATLQVWNFYRNFPDDSGLVKLMVALVYLADILQSVLFIHVTYRYTITGFVNVLTTGDPRVIAGTPWSLQASIPVVALIIIVVQSYYCLNVYRVTASRVLAGGCWLLALARMGLSLALNATSVQHPTIAVVTDHTFKWETITVLSIGAFSDMCIAVSMSIGLLRRRTGFAHSDRLVDKLVAYAVGSGAATSIVSVVELVTYVTLPTTYVWIAFFSIVSKLFTNSLLASLNQRGTHRVVTFAVQQATHASSGSTRVNVHKKMATSMELTSVNETDCKPVLSIGRCGDTESV